MRNVHPGLSITRRKQLWLNDGTYLSFYEAIDNKHKSRTENYAHCSPTGRTLEFFEQTHVNTYVGLRMLLKEVKEVILLQEIVVPSA